MQSPLNRAAAVDHTPRADLTSRVAVLGCVCSCVCRCQAGPSTPVRVVGLHDFPKAGEDLLTVPNEERAKGVLEGRLRRDEIKVLVQSTNWVLVQSTNCTAALAVLLAAGFGAGIALCFPDTVGS